VQYLVRAINLRQVAKGLPPLGDTNMVTIIGFNDSFGRSFADVAAVLSDATLRSIAVGTQTSISGRQERAQRKRGGGNDFT
jgi:hypothetical protein